MHVRVIRVKGVGGVMAREMGMDALLSHCVMLDWGSTLGVGVSKVTLTARRTSKLFVASPSQRPLDSTLHPSSPRHTPTTPPPLPTLSLPTPTTTTLHQLYLEGLVVF